MHLPLGGTPQTNLITDVPGLSIGHAEDLRIGSGVTALIFDQPAVASVAVHGGAPGLRDSAMLEPEMTVEAVDALVLSGGSAYGLDAMGGVAAYLREIGRGFAVRDIHVPIVPGAILFDLLNGGDKNWGAKPAYWDIGYRAAANAVSSANRDFQLGSVGAGLGATTANLKGGLGSASAISSNGFVIGALIAVNALGQATIGDGPHFWASPYEIGNEFGGLGWPPIRPQDSTRIRIKGDAPENTTIGIVATDAFLTKAQAKRLATVAQDGLALALHPAHAALDGDTIFSAATGTALEPPSIRDLTEIGALAAHCVARAIARAVYEAGPLPFEGAQPTWKQTFGQ
ncbi:MAG: P1 family peptidase [Methylovirgula sp.]